MYETWFVAAAESLAAHLQLAAGEAIPADADASGAGKGWIKQHIRGGKYSEAADQASLTATMDLALCRQRSKSFDKLCRELDLRR
jgi:hypothetical protein